METLTKNLDLKPSVRCAFISDGRLLLVRRAPALITKHNPDLWELPGGQTELDSQCGRPLETSFQTARREAWQEVGLDLNKMTDPRFIELHKIDGGKYAGQISLTLAGLALEWYGEPRIDHESSAFGWFTQVEMDRMPDITIVSRLAIDDLARPLLQ